MEDKKKNKETLFLHKIPPEKLESFYKYQHYNMSLQKFNDEWDILAIFPDSKSVINIEVKRGPKEEGNKLNLLKKASKQTNNHFLYFQKLFGSKLIDDWNFIKAACVPYLEVEEDATEPCKHCQIYILKEKEMLTQTDIFTWIERLTLNHAQNTSSTDYENLVASIIGHSSLEDFSEKGLIISPLDQSKKVEASITGKNSGIVGESECNHKYLLNTEQLNVVHNKSSFLIIDGDYGTGKTFVLKKRVKSCAKEFKDEKIAYINLTGLLNHNEPFNIESYGLPTVMDIIAKNDLNHKNIEVVSCHDLFHQDLSTEILYENSSTEDVFNHCLNEFLVKNSFKHIYIDEMVPLYNAFNSWLSQSYETVCITMKFDEFDIENGRNWIEKTKSLFSAKKINLRFNMRNSENVKNASTVFSVTQSKNYYSLEPEKNIKGNNNYFYINKFNLKPGILAVAAINKYFTDCSRETVVVISSYKELAEVHKTISEYFPTKKCVCVNDNNIDMTEYLKQPDGIFCTSIENFQGAQARNIIIILDVSISAYEPRNYVLRTLAFAIVIESDVSHGSKQIVGFEEDCNLNQFKPKPNTSVDIVYFHNENYKDTPSLTNAVLIKYFNLELIESLVILAFGDETVFRVLEKQVSNASSNITCTYFKEHDLQSKDKKRNFNDLLHKPGQILFIQIHYSNFASLMSYHLSLANNIVIFTSEEYFPDDEKLKKFNSEYRNLILDIKPKFALVIHDGNIEKFTGRADYPLLKIIKDTDLKKSMLIDPHNCYHYQNVYKLDEPTITIGIFNKYFKDKNEESFIILSLEDKTVFKQLEKKVSNVLNGIVCTYFHQDNLGNEDTKRKLNSLLHKPRQIIFIQIQDLRFSYALSDLLSLAKSIVIFYGKKYFPQELQKKYNSECRNLILNIKPKVALVIHDGNNNKFSDPFLNMIEVTDLHNNIQIVPHDCYHYQNIYNIDQPTITLGVLDKCYKNKNEESLVILCPRSRDVFKHLEKKVSDVSSDFVCSHIQQNSIKNDDTWSELNDLLCKPLKQIIIIEIECLNFISELSKYLSLAKNIVIFSKKNHWSDELLKQYNSECRNLILNIRPKFALVIHDGDIEEFTGTAEYPLLNMIEDRKLHVFDCYHYKNIYNLDETTITLGVLDKYFKDKNEDSLVIVSLASKAVFKQLEKKVSGVSSDFVCTYYHQNSFKIKETKSELNYLLHKPRQIIFLEIIFGFSYAFLDLLSLAKNILIFSDEVYKEYNSECRNLILNIRPKFALVIHDEDIAEFTGPADYPLLNMIEDTDLHNNIQIVPHDCYHYQNKYNLDEPTIYLGVLDKYFKDKNEESLVIVSLESKAVFKQLERKVSGVSSDFVCTYFHKISLKIEDTKSELNNLLHKPRQIIFIQIQYLGFSYAFFDLLLLAKNIVIFSNKKYWSDDEELREYNSEFRNLILNIRAKFALVIHDGNIEEFTGTADYPLLNMIEDTDLHNNIQIVPHDCFHYQNKYNLDEPTISLGVLDKYFKDKNEESLVIVSLASKAVFKQLERKVSGVSSDFVCTYFHQDSLDFEDTKSKLNNLLHRPGQIIFIQIDFFWFYYTFLDLLSLAKNIVIFSNEKYWSDDEELKKYNSECRNLILKIRPKFALVIHDGNIEEFTGPADYPLLNMIEDTDLHNYIQIVPHDCYHYKNKYKLDGPTIILGILDKYFKVKNEESLIILTTEDKSVLRQLEKKVSDVSSDFVCSYFHQISLENEDTKSEINDLLHKPRQILIIQIIFFWLSDELFDLLSIAKNIVIFSNKKYYLDDEDHKEYKTQCRNLILKIKSKFLLVIHDGDIEEFTGPADHPLLNMNEVTDLHNNIQIDPQDCYHYQNKYSLDEPTITLGVLDKYFKDEYEESLVILTTEDEDVFKQLEKEVSDLSSDFVCSYFHQNILKNEDTKSELNDLLLKPRQIIYIQIQSFGFSYAFFDLLLLAKNIVIFSKKKYWSDDEELMEYNSECRNLILNIRPKLALVMHEEGDIKEFTGTTANSLLNMIEDTDLHNHVNSLN